MRRVALRGLLARKLRLALTALAVTLGVMLIAGTYIFTDTINASFDRIFSKSFAGTDVVVTPRAVFSSSDDTPPLPAALADRVRGVPGVATVEGGIFDDGGTFLGKDGKPFSTQGPKFLVSAFSVARFGGFSYAEGRAPKTADEVALDQASAEREGFAVGDRFAVQGRAPRKDYRVVGLAQVAGASSFGGASFALLTLPEAQRQAGKQGGYDQIDVAVRKGEDSGAVSAAVRAVLPAGAQARTGAQQASEQSREIRDNLSFLPTALLAFAGIALFVGAFTIFNTFSITVAQRARELALLRTLGASRGQVLRSVLAEGVVVGVLGSLVGLAAGIGVAAGLKALLKAFGVELPSTGTAFETRTVVVSLGLGIAVTLLATLAPALRATRVPPIAALREGVALPETRASRLAFPAALVLLAAGLGLMAYGLFADLSDNGSLSALGAGAGLTFLGAALLSPKLVGPIARVVGAPVERVFGVTGRLARENTVRQPGRTAVTAAALMIGVALVAFATIFAAGARQTVDDAIDAGLKGQAVLQNQDGFSGFSREAGERVARLPGVVQVGSLSFSSARYDGAKTSVSGVDDAFRALYRAQVPRLGAGTVAASRDWAEEHGVAVGDRLRLQTASDRRLTVRVAALVQDDGKLLADLVVPAAVVRDQFGEPDVAIGIVGYDRGADDDRVKAEIDRTLARDFPQVEALTQQEFKDDVGGQITQLLGLVYALLALAIVVSLFGIVNTLVLSITERTRELGLLRAIGTTRRQVRRIVRYEAVITALIGAVLGLVLGVVLSVLVTRALDDFALSLPVVSLLVVVALAGAAGVLAAILPARRAARLDVLRALADE